MYVVILEFEILIVTNVNNRLRLFLINVFVLTICKLTNRQKKLIILKFHIFYTYLTIKKILEVNKKQNKNLKQIRIIYNLTATWKLCKQNKSN
jgi:hypothetical protein